MPHDDSFYIDYTNRLWDRRNREEAFYDSAPEFASLSATLGRSTSRRADPPDYIFKCCFYAWHTRLGIRAVRNLKWQALAKKGLARQAAKQAAKKARWQRSATKKDRRDLPRTPLPDFRSARNRRVLRQAWSHWLQFVEKRRGYSESSSDDSCDSE